MLQKSFIRWSKVKNSIMKLLHMLLNNLKNNRTVCVTVSVWDEDEPQRSREMSGVSVYLTYISMTAAERRCHQCVSSFSLLLFALLPLYWVYWVLYGDVFTFVPEWELFAINAGCLIYWDQTDCSQVWRESYLLKHPVVTPQVETVILQPFYLPVFLSVWKTDGFGRCCQMKWHWWKAVD